MVASLRAFCSTWLAKDDRFVAWLLGQFGIVRKDRDEEGGERAYA